MPISEGVFASAGEFKESTWNVAVLVTPWGRFRIRRVTNRLGLDKAVEIVRIRVQRGDEEGAVKNNPT